MYRYRYRLMWVVYTGTQKHMHVVKRWDDCEFTKNINIMRLLWVLRKGTRKVRFYTKTSRNTQQLQWWYPHTKQIHKLDAQSFHFPNSSIVTIFILLAFVLFLTCLLFKAFHYLFQFVIFWGRLVGWSRLVYSGGVWVGPWFDLGCFIRFSYVITFPSIGLPIASRVGRVETA